MTTPDELRTLIAGGEAISVEFKSDRGPLSDTELVEVATCLANLQGGKILVGIEDDGQISGLHASRRSQPGALAAFIASRTVPPLSVESEFIALPEGRIAVLTVPAARQPIATSDGKLVMRFLDVHQKPGCRPLYPYELASWKADRGQADMTAMPIMEATWDDLDALEFARLRQMVEENRGDTVLLELPDDGIARALGLVTDDNGKLRPTQAGLLLVGKEAALRKYIPAHEIAFQVLKGSDIKVNEFRRWPLLRAQEWLMQSIQVRNEEQELMMGSLRIGVPRYDRRGIREAVNNALIHRDYARLGAVHVQLHDDHGLISNPGGFVLGVTPGNVLTASPHPRNPLLADAFKRIGLVERSGRGVGIIYFGQLQNGRRPPSYERSTSSDVTITLDARPANLDYVSFVVQTNRRRERPMQLPELMAVWLAWQGGPVAIPDLSKYLQIEKAAVESLLADLSQAGLIQIQDQMYELVDTGSKRSGDAQQIVLALIEQEGQVTRRSLIAALHIGEKQAEYLLKTWVDKGFLQRIGKGRSVYYIRNPKINSE